MSTDYLHPQTQRQRILSVSQHRRSDTEKLIALHQACMAWGASEQGQVILDWMVERTLLGPCLGERDIGKQDVVRDILRMMREGPERIRQLEESLRDGTA